MSLNPEYQKKGARQEQAMLNITERDIKRFYGSYKKGGKAECWEWNKHSPSTKYGQFYIKDVSVRPNRLSYYLHKGKIPTGKIICHTCDNPPCVNPKHLYAGTYRDNTNDAINRGRHKYPGYRGEKNGNNTLKEKEVIKIKKLFEKGEIPSSLARKFNVSRRCIYHIVQGNTWKHLLTPNK